MGLDADRPVPGNDLDRSNSARMVEMRGITKRFGSVTAVAGADFDLRSGEIHALLGENGAGKTTLMNLLYGLEQPDVGTILIDGDPVSFRSAHDAIEAGIGMVHQHFQLVPRLSVAENVMLGAGGSRRIRLPDPAEVADAVEELGERYGLPVSATSLVADLSVGEQQRVEILRALYRGARILILDEPTASLSPAEIDHLIEQLQGMASTGTAIVMITHHLDEVMTAADRITILRAGANVATVPAEETSPLELARLMVGREVAMLSEVGEVDEAATGAGSASAGPAVLTLHDLSSASEAGASGEHARDFFDVSLEVRASEIVTIAGVEGNGQAELEAVLCGLSQPAAGRIHLGQSDVTGATPRDLLDAGVGIIPSDRYRHGLIRGLSVAENLVYDRIGKAPYGHRLWIDPRAIAARGADLVGRFSIAVRNPSTAASALSGGNAQKVVLARALGTNLQLLIAAQPTRGLDVGAIEFVWNQIRDQRDSGVAVLLITTDLNEVTALSDRCFVIYRGRLIEAPLDREAIGLAMGGAGSRAEPASAR
ncbi:MAG: ABC transporter ATP-binding protein [Acidimicrobiaceae bacterium]|nr:ABC transporter ATP-binding protein [Acidimicrobiaceae bacterium]